MHNIVIIISALLLISSIFTLELSIIYYIYKFFKRSVVNVNLIRINIATKRFYSILIKRFLSIIRKISNEAFNINAPPVKPVKQQIIHFDKFDKEAQNG